MTGQVQSPPIAERVADHLQALILEGVLVPGEKLAAERELAEKLGVSRPSLRAALAILEERGLVRSGRDGTAVAEFMNPVTLPLARLLGTDERGIGDYFEYRLIVEPQAAALAAQRVTEPDRAELAACIASMKAAFEAGDAEAEAEADVQFHRLVHGASHNLVLAHTMGVFARLLRDGILSSRAQFFRRQPVRVAMLEQHGAILAAILAGDAGEAEAAMRRHVAFAAETFVAIRQEDARAAESRRRAEGRGILAG